METPTTTDVITPTVHLNGTSKDALIKGYHEALTALTAAEKALTETAPHPRDYYVQKDPSAYQRASFAHRARMLRLKETKKEILAIAELVMEQGRG